MKINVNSLPKKSKPTDIPQTSSFNPTIKEGGRTKHDGKGVLDFLSKMLGSRDYSLSDEEFQYLFEHAWQQHSAEQSQEWSREDAYVAWLRSLESSKYNAQLGLETQHASNSQLYNQLISLGMSPQAAMQAVSGNNAPSSGAGSAPMGSTAQAGSVPTGGNTAAERMQLVLNGSNMIQQAVSQFGSTFLTLLQNQSQFEANQKMQADQFARANWLNDALSLAASSDEFRGLWTDAIQFAQTDCPASALTSPLAFRRQVASSNPALQKRFDDVRSKYGWAADSYFDSQFANVMNSQSQDVSLKIQQATLEGLELKNTLSKVNLESIETNLDWLKDKYEDYQQLRGVMNTLTFKQLSWKLEKLRMVADNPVMVDNIKKEIAAMQEAKTINAEINKVIASGVFEKFDNSDFLGELLETKRLLDMCGVSSVSKSIISAGAAFLSKGRSLIGEALNAHNDITEPEVMLNMVDDYGNEYYFDEDQQAYVPY